MKTTKIGWIGLGRMGTPMSKQLINAGYPVNVYNRNKAKEESLKLLGATTALSPGQLIQQVDVVIVMVSDDLAIWEIFTGNEGLFSIKTTGKIIINMSTV
jgi:3-hydroxyisobutyrate dehydrogenase